MSIYKQLLEVQKEVGAISKDSKNPFFKSKYFDINKLLEVVKPVLSKHGLILLQPIKDNKVYSQILDSESTGNGTCIESWLELPNLTDPQKIGSAISYYRRFTLVSLLGLEAEDEDGNGLKAKPKPVQKQQVKNWEGLLKAVTDGTVTSTKAFNTYSLTQEQIEKLNKAELIKK